MIHFKRIPHSITLYKSPFFFFKSLSARADACRPRDPGEAELTTEQVTWGKTVKQPQTTGSPPEPS